VICRECADCDSDLNRTKEGIRRVALGKRVASRMNPLPGAASVRHPTFPSAPNLIWSLERSAGSKLSTVSMINFNWIRTADTN
jgi:hypothetical protein